MGRDSLWWGPGLHGSLIFSNNAPPLDQVRIGAAEPFHLPWIVDRYFLPTRDLRLYGEFGWDDTCCSSSSIPLRGAISGLVGLHLLRVFGREGVDARFEYAETSGLSFTHSQFRSGYWTRGEVLSHFIGTEGRDYLARVTNRLTPNLMLGVELNRAVVGSTVARFRAPKERRVGGGVDLSYRFWERYSLSYEVERMKVQSPGGNSAMFLLLFRPNGSLPGD